jgi:hypothetical protein
MYVRKPLGLDADNILKKLWLESLKQIVVSANYGN